MDRAKVKEFVAKHDELEEKCGERIIALSALVDPAPDGAPVGSITGDALEALKAFADAADEKATLTSRGQFGSSLQGIVTCMAMGSVRIDRLLRQVVKDKDNMDLAALTVIHDFGVAALARFALLCAAEAEQERERARSN